MSFATAIFAPLILAAIEQAPLPLPTSKILRLFTTEGVSKMNLQQSVLKVYSILLKTSTYLLNACPPGQ